MQIRSERATPAVIWPAIKPSDLIHTNMQLTSVALTTIIDMLKGTRPPTSPFSTKVMSRNHENTVGF